MIKDDNTMRKPNTILLEIVKHAADMENERKKNIETRAGLALAFLATTIVFLLKETSEAISNDKNSLSKVVRESFLSVPMADFTRLDWILIFDIILCIIVVILSFHSLLKFVDVFAIRDYKALEIDDIINMALREDETIFVLYASGIYMLLVEHNKKLTDVKVNSFEKGILLLKYSVMATGMRYLVLFVFKN